jgi:peptidoglycan/LPS O-acetylase OafA/YrhL
MNGIKNTGPNFNYRADIDGIRAISILAVVLYHAFPKLLPGGFIGVDIFFVISGYLITSIILIELSFKKFNFIDFYKRRIRRIFPALLIVLASCLLFGWFTLSAEEYRQLSKHSAAGIGFISNILFWQESGYFDNTAELKPLLHLWSLGIEEQFYFIWPIIILLMLKNKFKFFIVIFTIIIISFCFNIYYLHSYPVAVFFLPPSRFWELMIGSLIAWLFFNWPEMLKNLSVAHLNFLSLLGLLLIFLGFSLINKESFFPGWLALIPVVGASLLIVSGKDSYLNRVLLSAPILVFFGLISFPLYLWHWPLLVFPHIFLGESLDFFPQVFLVIFSILLAWLTYRYIEIPLRVKNYKKSISALIFLALLVFIFGIIVWVLESNNLLNRKFKDINIQSGFDGGPGVTLTTECGMSDNSMGRVFSNCLSDSRGNIRYALIGDSKAASLFPGLVRTSSQNGRWMFIGGNGARGPLVPLISTNPMYAQYQEQARLAIESLKTNKTIDVVVVYVATRSLFQLKDYSTIEDLGSSTKDDFVYEGLANTVREILDSNKSVILIMDNPSLRDPNECIARKFPYLEKFELIKNYDRKNCSIGIEEHNRRSQKYVRILHSIKELDPNRVSIFSTLNIMCDENTRVCLSYKDNKLLYSYTDHISDFAGGIIGLKINQILSAKEMP